MSSTNDVSVAPLESAKAKRVRRLQRRRERETGRAHCVSETTKQRLSRRRIRDGARRKAQSVEQKQILLQRRWERLNAGEQRDVRLQQMREL